VISLRHEEAVVLLGPARSADVGAGDHDDGDVAGPTHGAHGVHVVVSVTCLILSAVQDRGAVGNVIDKDGRHGQTQIVGTTSAHGVISSSHHP
jgi:hypothetical protein